MAYKSMTAIAVAGELETQSDDPGKDAIDICMESWNSAHDEQAEIEGSSNWDCKKAGNQAYLEAVPSLSGYRNICDFIASINYASMTGIIIHTDAAHYLANARIALSTIYHRPKPARKRGGRQPKSSAKGEQ